MIIELRLVNERTNHITITPKHSVINTKRIVVVKNSNQIHRILSAFEYWLRIYKPIYKRVNVIFLTTTDTDTETYCSIRNIKFAKRTLE